MIPARNLLAAALLSALAAGPVAAQGTALGFGEGGADTDAPVEVTSERLSVDQETGVAIFSGEVVVVQGEMRLTAPEVRVIYSEEAGEIDRFEATGGVLLVNGEDAAEAQRADYDVASGNIVMTGEVLLTQGRTTVASERMIVNLEAGTAELTGRVRTVLQPAGAD